MLTLKRTLAAFCFFSLCLTCQLLPAGYPPFGAWAYGSGWHTTGHLGHWHGRAVYAQRGVYRSSYSPWGYTTVRTRSVYRPFAYTSYPSWYTSYSFYAPIVSYPTYYVPTYAVPTVVWPTYYSVPVYPSYCTAAASTTSGLPSVIALASSQATTSAVHVASNSAADSAATQGQPVAIDYGVASEASSAIPESLLSAADAIFRAGGYREAATAYAQLNVRYGSSDQIFGRRFVAQVASGDLDQAAVILASAKAAGFRLDAAELPAGNLLGIFDGDSRKVALLTEQLAAHAMSASTEQEPLELVGQWLSLAGDQQRANLFLSMAARMQESTSRESLPTPLPKTELVSLE